LNRDLSADLDGVFKDTSADAYPVSTYSYIVVSCSPARAAKESPATLCSGGTGKSSYPARSRKDLGEFIDYFVCKGQQVAGVLGYAYLPKNLVKDAFAAIGRLNGAVEPPPPTSSNCADPALGS
jgi:phosphate transport system substrate-binding protein